MNTLGIIIQNIFLGNIVNAGHRRPFAMALAAEIGDIHLVGGGLEIFGRQNVMVSVTLRTGGGVGLFLGQRLTVEAGAKFLIGLVVTVAAFYWAQRFRMGKVLHFCIFMAPDAFDFLVNGPGEFLPIYEQRKGLPFSLRGQLGIRMTLQAVFGGRRARQGGEEQRG